MPPNPGGDPVLDRYGDALTGRWLGYLSSTGVYGDSGGAWVDERAPILGRRPERNRADAAWLALGARVFRLPGAYGALTQNCVANTPMGHVVLTSGPDVVLHYANEPRSIVQGKWRRWLEANIDSSNYGNSFVFAGLVGGELKNY